MNLSQIFTEVIWVALIFSSCKFSCMSIPLKTVSLWTKLSMGGWCSWSWGRWPASPTYSSGPSLGAQEAGWCTEHTPPGKEMGQRAKHVPPSLEHQGGTESTECSSPASLEHWGGAERWRKHECSSVPRALGEEKLGKVSASPAKSTGEARCCGQQHSAPRTPIVGILGADCGCGGARLAVWEGRAFPCLSHWTPMKLSIKVFSNRDCKFSCQCFELRSKWPKSKHSCFQVL